MTNDLYIPSSVYIYVCATLNVQIHLVFYDDPFHLTVLLFIDYNFSFLGFFVNKHSDG